jgi:hypothetical protein
MGALYAPDRREPLSDPSEMDGVADAAALAAAHFGDEWARRVLDELEDAGQTVLRNPARIGLILLIAAAEDADRRAADLVAAAHPRALDGVVALSLTMPVDSPALARAWRQKCRAMSAPARDCFVLLARYGDANALRTLELALQNEAPVSAERGLTSLFAQQSLFNDVGPRGIATLYRHISDTPIVAYRSVFELCKLGPHAGPGVGARAAALAEEFPRGFAPPDADAASAARDETARGFNLRTALRRCRASQPTLEGAYRLAAP